MPRWGMAIDLKKCMNCQTCVVACKTENFVPAGFFWNRILDYEDGDFPSVLRRFLPSACMHCEDPACIKVCPSGATQQRTDGVVYVDYTRCIGCRYCLVACPYQSRSFVSRIEPFFKEGFTEHEKFPYELREPSQRHETGTVFKCTLCLHRIDAGLQKGLKPGADEDATPACVVACISGARHFGDLNDANSEVAQLIKKRRGVRLHEHFGTRPSVYYLY
ncbi:MAG: 4Fe-4S dicluster domain-containing protein [Chloroflexi bacterium]|nr:4Fe-4S dicluster domain-containing protein [Chloroflexota bacterium]